MKHRRLLFLALVLGVLSLLPAIAGCNDDDPELPDDIDISDELPATWPDDFPLYPGAELESVLTSSEEGAAGSLAGFQTDDSVADVTAFYETAFEAGPWVNSMDPQIGDAESSFLIQRDDGSNADSSVAIGEDDGSTTIFVFLSDDP